jgi:hypothetical protein
MAGGQTARPTFEGDSGVLCTCNYAINVQICSDVEVLRSCMGVLLQWAKP